VSDAVKFVFKFMVIVFQGVPRSRTEKL